VSTTHGEERYEGGGARTAYPERGYQGYQGVGMRPRMRPSYPIETKPFFLTSEFALPLLAWFGLLITSLVADDVDARLFWYLTTAMLIGYMLSRGIAKSGTKSRSWDPREDPDLLRRGKGGDGNH
jgi:hypothetical protein